MFCQTVYLPHTLKQVLTLNQERTPPSAGKLSSASNSAATDAAPLKIGIKFT